jgi:uncharacterized protein (DUF934 family)
MRTLLQLHEGGHEAWQYLSVDPPQAGAAVIIPWAQWRDNPATWRTWGGPLGVQLAPGERPESLHEDLPRLALIAIEFPSPGEGRGYTQARLLRGRYAFTGELRAIGAVKRDQLFLMSRCGFDAFELAAGEDVADARRSLRSFSVAYQRTAAAKATPVTFRWPETTVKGRFG